MKRIAALLAFCLACDGGGSVPPTGHYEVVETGIDYPQGALAVGFNTAGMIALQTAAGPVRCTRDGACTPLLIPAGVSRPQATSMNEAGVVAGVATTEGHYRAVKWVSPESPPDVIPELRGVTAADINDDGIIVLMEAFYSVSARRDTAIGLWAPTGVSTRSIGTVSQGLVNARAINNGGTVLANVIGTSIGNVPLVLRPVGEASPLDCPQRKGGSRVLQGVALNDSGEFVVNSDFHSCLYRIGKPMVEMTLQVAPHGLNNRGRAVGRVIDSVGAHVAAAVSATPESHTAEEQLFARDADRGGWTSLRFLRINDVNEILASGERDGSRALIILRPRP